MRSREKQPLTHPDHPADNGVVDLVDRLLQRAVARRASDVHFEPFESGVRVRFRLDGVLHDVDELPGTLAENIVARLKVLAGLLTYRTDVPQEGAFTLSCPKKADAPIDVRVATFPTVRGERAAVRFLYQVGQVNGLDELGLSPSAIAQLRSAARRSHGLILVTGPAGSGKSTTLYALARDILAEQAGRSVVSLEDPVEQRVDGMAQIQISPYGELNYARAMRSLLRQDVQVLLVGEIRDADTAHVVIEAALTGHLIMSTMHSGDPAETIARLLEMGVAPYQVVSAVSVCCSQRLLRTVCETCRGKAQTDVDDSSCASCAGTGYRGRTACGQLLLMDDTLREAVLARRPVGELRRLIGAAVPDVLADANRLVETGQTTLDEVRRVLGT